MSATAIAKQIRRATKKRKPPTEKQLAAAITRRQAKAKKARGRRPKTNMKPTVTNVDEALIPSVYDDPAAIVARAAAQKAPENLLMQELFGVSRSDLDNMTFDHQRAATDPNLAVNQTDRGAPYRADLQNKANVNRLQDILSLASEEPNLAGSYGWYETGPLRDMFNEAAGTIDGPRRFDDFLQRGSVLSAGTPVDREIRRASLLGMLDEQGRADEFIHGDMASAQKVHEAFPDIFPDRDSAMGYEGGKMHASQRPGLTRHQESGQFYTEGSAMKAPKTPNYKLSKTGENLMHPTADAHFVRGIGLADARPNKSKESIGASEVGHIRDWFRDDVAGPIGMEGSPAQALLWNAMGKETGVRSLLSKPYLEMVVDGAEREAKKTGKPVQEVLNEFIMGRGKLSGAALPIGLGLLGSEDEQTPLGI